MKLTGKQRAAVVEAIQQLRGKPMTADEVDLLVANFEEWDPNQKSVPNDDLDQRDRDRILAAAVRPADAYDAEAARHSQGVTRTGGITVLKNSAKLFDHVRHDLPDGIRPQELDFGKTLRGMVTGDWDGAHAERKTLSSSDGVGGYLLPSPLSSILVDLARNQSVCMRAGAVTIPMNSGTLDIARLTSDPTGYWKQENAAGTASDIGTGRFTLRAKTLMALVKSSVELIEDAPNAGAIIQNALSAALALELDRACLRGTGAAAEPLGIKNFPGVQTIPTIGTLAGFDEFSSAWEMIQASNGPSEGICTIMNPREAGDIDRMKDGESKPILAPPSWALMKHLVSNQVSITGGGGAEGEAYVGDFSQLAVGVRTGVTLEVTRVGSDTDSSAFKNLQVWIRAYLRADLVLLQPTWFVYLSGITNIA
jgi:HK97 family phage major capsid protein